MPTVDYGKKVEKELGRIKSSDSLTEEDRDVLLDYKRDLEVEGLSDGRIFKVLVHARKFGERLGERSLVGAGEDDIKNLVAWVQKRDLADLAKRDYREILKRFYKWSNGREYPEKVDWISTTMKKKDRKLPEKMLDEDDVEKLLGATRNLRDSALISVMWETGARPGEYLDLEVEDVEDRENGKKVVIDGKTGPRRLPLVSSVPHLNTWLNQHPAGDSGAPLWCRLDGESGKRIDYDYFRKLLRQIADRAGVDKPMYPYQFRHSRATCLANHLTEAQMCEYFGWVQGSDRPRDYVHLTGRDIDPTYDEMFGLAEKEDRKPKLAPEKCPRCGEMNGKKAKFCSKCGLPLDEKTALEVDRKRKLVGEIGLKAEEIESTGSLQKIIEKAVEKKLEEELGVTGP